jgi:transcription antitermination factor NusG
VVDFLPGAGCFFSTNFQRFFKLLGNGVGWFCKKDPVTEVAKLYLKRPIFSPLRMKWLAVYTKPRWEKKVALLLANQGITVYCPLNRVYRQWSDRVKKVEEPLFKSYVFVLIDDAGHTRVRMTDGVLNFVYWNGKPAVIRPEEIAAIRRFLDEYEQVKVESLESISPGSTVQVISGVMMGAQAVVTKIDNKYAEVIIESIGYRLRAKISTRKLVAVKKNK